MQLKYHSSTDILNEITCPLEIRNAHQVDQGYFGILNVLSGRIVFVWEETNVRVSVDNSKPFFIPANMLHHVEFDEPCSFRVDFYQE